MLQAIIGLSLCAIIHPPFFSQKMSNFACNYIPGIRYALESLSVSVSLDDSLSKMFLFGKMSARPSRINGVIPAFPIHNRGIAPSHLQLHEEKKGQALSRGGTMRSERIQNFVKGY